MPNPLYDALFAPHATSDRPFLTEPIEGSSLSYAEFVARAGRVAQVLRDLGLKPGDRLAVQVGKSPAALAIYAGSVQAGVVYLPLNTAYTAAELGYFLADSGAKVLVCDPGDRATLEAVAAPLGAVLHSLSADGRSGTFADLVAAAQPSDEVTARGDDDLAALLYTSGTTGRSKGAMLTHRNLLSNSGTLKDLWCFSKDDVLLHALPVFHTHGLFVATNITLLAGGSMIFEAKFDLDRMIARLPFATAMMGVPTFYVRLISDDRFNRALTANMRLFVSGSAPLLADTHRAFEALTGHRILERYGMTETNMNTSNPYDGERRAGTVGFPLPGVDVKITDPDSGTEAAPGEIGQIEVRGPNVFKGYWQMPEKTREELRADGFFITGDLGRLDPDGYVVIVGRNKDLIISGGYNIYPKEIEEVLDAQPGVVESAVIGVPHPDFGETPVAVVAADAAFDEPLLMATVESKLARFKHPRRIIVLDELPRNTMGKVQKNVLRDRYADLFQG